jgi:membrane-bound serine protease (ClpP class)
MILVDAPGAWAKLSLRIVVPAVGVTAGFLLLCVWLVLRSQRRAVATGPDALIGETGRCVHAIESGQLGKVVFHGEVWTATSDEDIDENEAIVVTAIEGRTAHVRRAHHEGE